MLKSSYILKKNQKPLNVWKIQQEISFPWDFWYCLYPEKTFFFFFHDDFIFYHRETQTPPSYPICEAIHNRKVKLLRTRVMASLLDFGRRMRAAVVILSLPGSHSKLTGDLHYCITQTLPHYWPIKWRFYFKGLKTVHKHEMPSSHGILWMWAHVCALNTTGIHIWNI